MRYEHLGRSLALSLAAALFLAAGASSAQEAECFPACRTGYLCHEGACISSCNPPCADDERCTAEGECVPKAPVVAPPVAAPEEPKKPPYVPKGGVLGLGAGALLCVSDGICDTSEHDVGVAATLRGGYRVLPWLVVDVEVTAAPLVVKSSTIVVDRAILLAAGLGARFLPLARRHAVDPVLGLHVGYFLEWTKYSESADTSVSRYWFHGVHLAYSAGVDFNLSELFSLGVALDVFEPFRVSECDAVDAQLGDPLAGIPSEPASKQCAKPATASRTFYLGVGLTGTFLI